MSDYDYSDDDADYYEGMDMDEDDDLDAQDDGMLTHREYRLLSDALSSRLGYLGR